MSFATHGEDVLTQTETAMKLQEAIMLRLHSSGRVERIDEWAKSWLSMRRERGQTS